MNSLAVFFWSCILLFSSVYELHSQSTLDSAFVNHCQLIQEKVYNEEFDAATELVRQNLTSDSLDAQKYFLFAAIYHWQNIFQQITKTNDSSFEKSFLDHIDKAITLSKFRVKFDKRRPLWHLLLGAGYGYKGLFLQSQGKLISAVRNGTIALEYLNKALKLDSTLIDCYYGIGLYNYYVGKQPVVNKLVPLFYYAANKDTGIKYLERVHRNGVIARVEASFMLSQVYFEEKLYPKSFALLNQLCDSYPRSSVFAFQLMMNHFNLKQFEESIKVARRFLQNVTESNSVEQDSHKPSTGLIYFAIARSFHKSGKYKEALNYMNKFLAIKHPTYLVENAEKLVAYYQRKLNQL